MSIPIFPNGIRGLSDSKWSGAQGEAHKLVGVDFRSEPRVVKAHQKLDKISSVIENDKEVDVVDELCNSVVTLDDGNRVWFSSESGKIWKQDPSDNFSLLHTLDVTNDYKEPNSNVGLIFENKKQGDIPISSVVNRSYYGRLTEKQKFDLGVSYVQNGYGNYAITNRTNNVFVMTNKYNENDGKFEGWIHKIEINKTSPNVVMSVKHEEEVDYNGDTYNSIDIGGLTNMFAVCNAERDIGGYDIRSVVKVIGQSNLNTEAEYINESVPCSSQRIKSIDNRRFIIAYNEDGNVVNTKIKLLDYTSGSITLISSLTESLGEIIKIERIDNNHFMLISYGNKMSIVGFDESYNLSLVSNDNKFYGDHQITDVVFTKEDNSNFVLISSDKDGTLGRVYYFEMDVFYNITFIKSELQKNIGNVVVNKFDKKHIITIGNGLDDNGNAGTFSTSFEIKEDGGLEEVGTSKVSSLEYQNFYFTDTPNYNGSYGLLTIIAEHGNLKYGYYDHNTVHNNSVVLKPEKDKVKVLSAVGYAFGYENKSENKITLKIPKGKNRGVVIFAGAESKNTQLFDEVKVDGVQANEINNTDNDDNFGLLTGAYYVSDMEDNKEEVEIIISRNPNYVINYIYLAVVAVEDLKKTSPVLDQKEWWNNYNNIKGNQSGQLTLSCATSFSGKQTVGDHQKEVLRLEDETGPEDGSAWYLLDSLSVVVSSRLYNPGTNKIVNAKMFSYQEIEVPAKEENDYKYGNGEIVNDIFFCNDDVLFRINENDIDDWANKMETVDNFKHGSDSHSMVVQNLELFIADKHSIAKVSKSMEFLPEVFGGLEPEEITSLTSFDTDILIGTKNGNQARVLRWDCFDRGYYAQDEIFEKGVNTFIKDDNYTYVSVGETGKLYYYNGEKLDLFKRIDGGWDKNNTAIIHDNSVTTFNGIPLFGLSTKNGTPTEMGLYGLGSYSNRYPKSLSLDFPVPTSELDNVKIGAMTVRDCDLYVSYKTETDVGIAKLNHNKKYPNAYIETTMLTDLRERGVGSIIEGVTAEYVELPEDTDVKIGSKTKYDDDYVDMDTVIDTGKMLVGTKNNIPNISNLQLRFELLSKDNDSPVIENFSLC